MTSGASDQEAGLPVAETFQALSAATDGDERKSVFGNLVTSDTDIVGLVAYSIYKQNKHDWLVSFAKAKSRDPNEAELQSYIIGESTARRLATYRHLAEATLEGRGPVVSTRPATESFAQRTYAVAQRNQTAISGGASTGMKALLYVLGALVVLLALYLAARYGMPAPVKP